MSVVKVIFENANGTIKDETSQSRIRDESDVLFNSIGEILEFIQAILDDVSFWSPDACESTIRIALIDEGGMQRVKLSRPLRKDDAEFLFMCISGILLSNEVSMDKVRALTKARIGWYGEDATNMLNCQCN